MNEAVERTETVTAEETDAGERVDKALAARLPGLTRSVVQKLLAEGRVTLWRPSCAQKLQAARGGYPGNRHSRAGGGRGPAGEYRP